MKLNFLLALLLLAGTAQAQVKETDITAGLEEELHTGEHTTAVCGPDECVSVESEGLMACAPCHSMQKVEAEEKAAVPLVERPTIRWTLYLLAAFFGIISYASVVAFFRCVIEMVRYPEAWTCDLTYTKDHTNQWLIAAFWPITAIAWLTGLAVKVVEERNKE